MDFPPWHLRTDGFVQTKPKNVLKCYVTKIKFTKVLNIVLNTVIAKIFDSFICKADFQLLQCLRSPIKPAGTCANIQKHKCTHLHMWKHCIFIFGCGRLKLKSPLLSQVLLFRLTWFLHPLSRTSTHTQNTHILFQHWVTNSTNTQRHMHTD